MARTFPAAEVFIERAAATGAAHLSDSDSAIVASICRKLDGIPLAIELTAGRVAAYGLRQTAELLDRRLGLLWEGRRTAPPRQQTLRATLDWSYGLLTDLERTVLRGIAVFVGQFTLDAALSVVSCATLEEPSVIGAIDSLVAKSMIATQPAGAMMQYRLLETTRAYVCDITTDDPELAEWRARHAAYYRRWLESGALDWPILSNASERALHLAKLANVRAALEWSLAPNDTAETSGTTSIGIQLAAAAAPVFWGMSLASECAHWCERAIRVLDDAMRGSREEMRLQATLGMSLLYTRGANEAAGIAVHRSLAIAETLGDGSDRLLPTSPLEVFSIYKGNYETALYYGRLAVAIAEASNDLIAAATTRAGLGLALYHMGDFGGASSELEASLRLGPAPRRISTTHFNDGFYVSASVTMAKTLWMRGFPVQAVERIERTVEEFSGRDLPVPLSNAVGSAIMMSLWTGDLKSAEAYIDWYITFAETNGFGPQVEFGRGYRGALAIQLGDTKNGVDLLLACVERLSAARVEMLTSIYNIPLAQGLAAEGRFDEGLTLIDRTAHWVDTSGEACYLPEILRVRGDLLLKMRGYAGNDKAEACFVQSLDISRSQGALSWELRTATSFAKLRRDQGRIDEARGVLARVYQRFTEGFDTADLIAAKRLLEELG
jgi:predicted ATPase